MSIPVLLGLGANLGDPRGQLIEALGILTSAVEIEAVSSVYRTEPVGMRDQPEFLNIAVTGRTRATVYALHALAQEAEARLGRVRGERNAPRLIDVDLLAYGELVMVSRPLEVPHPRLHQRAFVLVPLEEIVPRWRHPVLGRTAGELLGRLANPSAVRRLGPLASVEPTSG